ncbi:MAG: DAK2 domain-containing protein [Clostridia bacterium]|nr:DAK2 domain-containing protein [Clostridia bacterium]
MATATLNGKIYAEMIKGGAAMLNQKRDIVNDLNVFPIPDGDTGDNMFMTIESGVDCIGGNETDDLGKTAKVIATGMLSGARGNSGAILSQIFAGISKGFEGVSDADISAVCHAFECGVHQAYKAVKEPVEGTILTVFREAVSYANEKANDKTSLEDFFDDLITELYASLKRTPDLLAVLKEAGVVDSGGAGFVYIAEGMKKALTGDVPTYEKEVRKESAPKIDISTFTEDSELKFGYCTEFLLRLQNKKCDVEHFDLKTISDYLDSAGDSVVAFMDGSVVKAHVHTFKPGEVLNYCQQFGEFLTLKIENMTLQHNETTIQNNFEQESGSVSGSSQAENTANDFEMRTKLRKRYGLVSCAAGEGVKNLFIESGCDVVVDGGQSMNPSVGDFLKAFDEVNADTIFVFPNNGNIIMTANQAAELYEAAKVTVLPTKNIGSGYAAISMFDPDGDEAAVLEALQESADASLTAMVSRAVRDTDKDGVSVLKDSFIGFVGSTIYSSAAERNEAAMQMFEKLDVGDYGLLMVLRGEGASEDELAGITEKIGEKYPSLEVIPYEGGQPVFDYIFILL